MRTITVSPGAFREVMYTYRPPGSLKAVHLVCRAPRPRPPKTNRNGTGVGDRTWLMNTPFLTVDLTDDSSDGMHRVLFAIDADADADAVGARVLQSVGEHWTVALPEEDADFVAECMRMPMMVVTETRGGRLVAVYRRPGQA